MEKQFEILCLMFEHLFFPSELNFYTRKGKTIKLNIEFSVVSILYVRAGRPAFARPYAGVHRNTSLMSSSLLLQQCPACLVRLTCIVFVMEGKWPYSWCLVGCWHQDLFNIALNIKKKWLWQYSYHDGREVAIQLVPCGVLLPGRVQYWSQHSSVIAV